jgi:hypothetical protein
MSTEMHMSHDGYMNGHPFTNNRTLSKLLNLEEQYHKRHISSEAVAEMVLIYGVTLVSRELGGVL